VAIKLMTACQTSPLERARQQIPIGMPREEAVRILSSRAWYYQACKREGGMDDLFFFGSRRYDEADIVIVVSSIQDGTYRVLQVGSFEPYAWQAAYRDCIDRDRFQMKVMCITHSKGEGHKLPLPFREGGRGVRWAGGLGGPGVMGQHRIVRITHFDDAAVEIIMLYESGHRSPAPPGKRV
jgi:hypothetical protein